MSTPNEMRKAFVKTDGPYSIRSMEAVDFVDPASNASDDEWKAAYGDNEYVFDVRVRYPEVKKPLTEGYTYSSWSSVEKTINKKIKETEKSKNEYER